MRLPKRGEKGFTLIELLIVVAILGVLAAVVIPNVTRFVGAGEEEAAQTELHNIQLAVTSMMLENGLTSIPSPVTVATDDMTAFPDATSTAGIADQKERDPNGVLYIDGADPVGDKDGYLLYGHDITGGDDQVVADLVNYVVAATTQNSYTCATDGTVTQAP